MPKDDRVYIDHMLETANKAVTKIKDKTRTDFDQDENLRLALTHLLQIIGEAASHISKEFTNQHPEIPWEAIVGMRHKVVHDYLGVDEDIVWDTVHKELAPFIKQLAKIV